jgi:hypothetical protein
MPYSDKQFKTTNTNYLSRDFGALKSTLMQYAKSYFPNTYRDFNETSPGMMFIEMAAYVGDVLNFYIDKQYKEMMLPLAEERKNVVNIAKMLGYKVKPTAAAFVDLTATQVVGAITTDSQNIRPNYDHAIVVDKDIQLKSSEDPSITFETLDSIDFTISSSQFTPEPSAFDTNGLVTQYTLTRKVKAVGGKTKTKVFDLGTPSPFLELKLNDTDVIDILSVTDSNGNKWYEVDYLAQDKVPIEKHYTDDWINEAPTLESRINAYVDVDGETMGIEVPYTLEFIKTPKRFMVEINEDSTTSLLFGNGLLRTATTGSLQSGYFQTQQAGITVPGEPSSFADSVSPVLATVNSSLGEIPSNIQLRVKYRIGGGMKTNVPALDLVNPTNIIIANSNTLTPTGRNFGLVNNEPARGGNDTETIDEIKHRARAHFITQNRCVTKEDYEARTLSMPAKFGNIAKVFVRRSNFPIDDQGLDYLNELQSTLSGLDFNNDGNIHPGDVQLIQDAIGQSIAEGGPTQELSGYMEILINTLSNINSFNTQLDLDSDSIPITQLPTVELYTLSYNHLQELAQSPSLLHSNLKAYLNQYRIISDSVNIKNGYIVNFGVYFDVVAHKGENKSEVKLKCIQKIIEYFNINKMHFHQTVYTSEIEYELMDIDGVRAVNFVQLGQGTSVHDLGDYFEKPLWNLQGIPGVDEVDTDTNPGYGWYYDFSQFYNQSQANNFGVIVPSVEPSVFELKNPNKNIKGVVR